VVNMSDDRKIADILHYTWEPKLKAPSWANQRLYRSAVMSEGLPYFFRVQAAVTDQFAVEQQHGDFVAVARSGGGIGIDIDHLEADSGRCRQGCEFAQHLLAKTATRA